MAKREKETQQRVQTAIWFIIALLIIIGGFALISSEGLLRNDEIIKIFLIYGLLNFTLPVYTAVSTVFNIKYIKSLLFRPQDSLIYRLWEKDKKNPLLSFLNTINNSAILSLLFWLPPLMLVSFLGSLFRPQSSIGIFVQRYVFPVRPQSIFDVLNSGLFFTLVPAPSETGALTVLVSLVDSLIRVIFTVIFNEITLIIISMILVSALSGLFWRWIHSTVSAGRQLDVIGHTIFGIESGALIILTGQWTPALALHIANLFYWYLMDRLASFELLRYGLVSLLLITSLSITLGVVIYRTKNKRKKRR